MRQFSSANGSALTGASSCQTRKQVWWIYWELGAKLWKINRAPLSHKEAGWVFQTVERKIVLDFAENYCLVQRT